MQEKGFCLSKQAPYLSSLHHFLPLTSKVNGRSTRLKLSLGEPLTFGACLLLLTLERHHKIKEMSWYAEIILMWKAWHVCVLYSLTHTDKKKKACLFELKPANGKGRKGEFSLEESVNTQSKGKSNSELNSGLLSFSTQHAL